MAPSKSRGTKAHIQAFHSEDASHSTQMRLDSIQHIPRTRAIRLRIDPQHTPRRSTPPNTRPNPFPRQLLGPRGPNLHNLAKPPIPCISNLRRIREHHQHQPAPIRGTRSRSRTIRDAILVGGEIRHCRW
ncbi:hypothetical protein LINPERHAP1_LOCUS35884 [Linum perenne]